MINYLLAFILLFGGSLSAADLPNIVFYIADDLSKTDVSVYGYEAVNTPNMQRLAGQGVTFERAFIASPACAPSRAALLTGLMPARNGAEANHTYPRDSIQFMTQQLHELGYRVLAFGKVAHGKVGDRDYGFDYYEPVPKRGDLSGAVEKYLQDNPTDQPLCVLVGDHRPHVSWIPTSTYSPDSVHLPDFLIDTPETRNHWARYLTDIEGLDQELGDMMEWAQERFGDNHLMLFSADHGSQWPFGKWNLYDYGTNVPLIVRWPGTIEAGTRTEAMVSWVDIFPTLISIAEGEVPNGLDGKSFAAVLTDPASSHRNLIFTTHTGDGIMNVYPIRSVRTDRYKLIQNLYPEYYHSNHSDILRKDGAGAYWDSWNRAEAQDSAAARTVGKYYVRPAEEFYDLALDPTEQNNLIDAPEHQKTIKELRNQLTGWMQAQNDQKMLANDPYPVSGPRPPQVYHQTAKEEGQ